jgi:hypothetical protein
MAADEKSKLDVPWGTLLPLIAVLAGIIAQYKPLVSERPPAPGEKSVEVVAEQDVDARLWQDPLAVTRKEEQAHKGDKKITSPSQPTTETTEEEDRHFTEHHNINALSTTIDNLVAKDRVLLLAVMLDAGPYVEQGESRLRTRQAVLQALSEGKFVPVDGEHIGFVTAPWPPESITTTHPEGDGELLLPWESCKAADTSTARVFPRDTSAVVVLWLPATGFDRSPLNRFAYLVESLLPRDKRDLIDVKLIGPVSSSGLQTIIDEIRNPNFIPNRLLSKVSVISPRATMSDDALLYRPPPLLSEINNFVQRDVSGSHVPLRETVKPEIENAFPVGFSFVRTITTDDRVIEKLIAELKLRGVNVKRFQPNDKIIILTEWDSPYVRSLAVTFGAKASGKSYASVLENPMENWPKSIEWYRYLRGIDGRLPGEEVAKKEPDGSQKNQVTPVQRNPEEESTEGVNQSDYLRRLARVLQSKDVIWQRRGGGIRAIGLFGSDIYDKLMILRALRSEFPDAVFFTNNFDAHFERQTDWPNVHNLVIVSPFGSTLERGVERPAVELAKDTSPIPDQPGPIEWQPNAAPFRDNIQTSMYVGTLVATGLMPAETASSLATPKIFEISKHGAYNFDAPETQTHWFLDWLHTRDRPIWLAVAGVSLLVFACWLRLTVVDVGRVQRVCTHNNKAGFGCALRQFTDALFCNTPLWLAFWVPAIVLGVSFFAQTKADAEPLAFFSGISIWPTEMLRLFAIVLALHFMIKASFLLKDNECEITTRFGLDKLQKTRLHFNVTSIWDKLKEVWAGLRRMQKEHAAWLNPGAQFTANAAWLAYLRRNQFGPRVVRVGLLTLVFGSSTLLAGLFLIFTKPTAAIPARGMPAVNFHDHVATWLTIVITALTFYVVDAIQLNGNFIRLFASGFTEWPPQVSAITKRIPPLTAQELSRYHDVVFVADRTEVVAHLIWYPLIVLALVFLGRSSLFDNWTWVPAMILLFVIIAMWAIGSAAFLRRAAEQLRDIALRNLELLQASMFAADDTQKTFIEERRREVTELIEEIRSLKKGAFAPISEQPFVRAILYPTGGLGLLAVALRLYEGV